MKKLLFSLLLSASLSLSAQELENVVMLDLVYIYTPYEHSAEGGGAGVKYEYALSETYSIALGVGGMTFSRDAGDYFKLDIRPEFRLYLGADAPGGLFTGISAGYTYAGVGEKRFHFPTLSASAGYKFMIGYFVLEAALGYTGFFDFDNLWKPETEIRGKVLLGFAF